MTKTPSILLATVLGMSLATSNVMADTKASDQKTVAAALVSVKAPMRMTDAEMAKIVAGAKTPVFQEVWINGVCYYMSTRNGSVLGKTCH